MGSQIFSELPDHWRFQIFTDHYSLQWLRSMKSESALLHRWASQLEDYQFDIIHRPERIKAMWMVKPTTP